MSVGGIGGATPPDETRSVGDSSNDNSQVNALMQTQVRTLGDLKHAMIQNLGKEKGEKMFNTFMQSMVMQSVTQMQQSAQQAKEASDRMAKAEEQTG